MTWTRWDPDKVDREQGIEEKVPTPSQKPVTPITKLTDQKTTLRIILEDKAKALRRKLEEELRKIPPGKRRIMHSRGALPSIADCNHIEDAMRHVSLLGGTNVQHHQTEVVQRAVIDGRMQYGPTEIQLTEPYISAEMPNDYDIAKLRVHYAIKRVDDA